MLYQRWMHRKERFLTLADTNRQVLPFDWGLDWLHGAAPNGSDPLQVILDYAAQGLQNSTQFFGCSKLTDCQFDGHRLTFPSPLESLDSFNGQASFRYFQAAGSDRAVVVVPQWNADEESHIALCRILTRLGISALRICLPYHEERRPPRDGPRRLYGESEHRENFAGNTPRPCRKCDKPPTGSTTKVIHGWESLAPALALVSAFSVLCMTPGCRPRFSITFFFLCRCSLDRAFNKICTLGA